MHADFASYLQRLALAPLAALIIGIPAHGATVEDSGVRRITLRITNLECAAMSPQGNLSANPNPGDLNDGELDDAEIVALEEGCHLRAYAVGKTGKRVANVPLYLYRAPADGGRFRRFGAVRRTSKRGLASWGFPLGPDTNFVYEVQIKSGEVKSNEINIQLCTGRDTANIFPSEPEELGKGCDVPGEGSN
ncbi:MAG: hypothetical protein RL417_409 [Pseudomonadota bacterium]|jgi:hypothetical protein